MSIFRTASVTCPSCRTAFEYDLVHSVNAGRRPDLREAVLDRSFQRVNCAQCGTPFRIEPEFSYMDQPRGQFLAVWPAAHAKDWADYEQRSREAFATAYGKSAPPEAREIGDKLTARMVFGWQGLNEKLLAADLGVDDVTLELAKLAVLRGLDSAPSPAAHELRLLGADAKQLVFGWFRTGEDQLLEEVAVARGLLDEIRRDAPAWKDLRAELESGMFVDFRRLFLVPA
jgi:hypothetical protein